MKNIAIQKKKVVISLLLVATLVLGSFTVLPGKAYAASSSDIAVGDFIDIGKADAPGYTGTPLWRVLEKNDDGSMLLMSEYLWTGNGTDPAFKVRFINKTGSEGQTKVVNGQVLWWRGTDAYYWCEGLEEAVLADIEGLTIIPTTKKVDKYFYYEQTLYPGNNKELHFAETDPQNSVLYEDKLFFLSAEDAVKYMPAPADRVAYLPGGEQGESWLLRSSQNNTNWASTVKDDGELTAVQANTGAGARPVFWASFSQDISFKSVIDESGRKVWTIGEDPADDLEKAKADAKTELESIDTSKYSGDEKAAVEKAIADAIAAIEAADSPEAVADALKSARTAISVHKTDADKAADAKKAAEEKAKTVKTVTVNVKTVNAAAVDKAVAAAGGSKEYVTKIVLGKKVKTIKSRAFKKYTKVNTLEVKSKKLTKKSVRNSLKGSKVKTVKVKVGKKKLNKKYVKKYKKIFTKKNAGKKVKIR